MRSYYDILKNYMEEKSLNGLHDKWYNCLINGQAFNPNRFQFLQAYPSFNQMNHFYILQDLLSRAEKVDYYKANKNGRLSKSYESLIRLLEEKEDSLLTDKLGLKVEEWSYFKNHRRKQTNKVSFDITKLWNDWLEIQNLQSPDLKNHFNHRLKNPVGRLIIKAINNYYNPWSRIKGIPTYRNSEEEIEDLASNGKDLSINFHSRSDYQEPINLWSHYKSDHSVQFFQSEDQELFQGLNEKAHANTISVKGTLNNHFTLPVEPTQWFDESLCEKLLSNSESELSEYLTFNEKSEFEHLLNHRIQELYLIRGFEITIETFAKYSEKEVEFLSSGNYRLFPFYFDDNLDYKREISHGGDGSLKFTLKSLSHVPIIIGSGVKKLCNR